MKTLIFLCCHIIVASAYAESSGIKNEDGSFKISEMAKKHMGISFMTVKGLGPWEIPASAIVKIKFTSGIYRQYENNISYVLVKILRNNGATALVESMDLESGDEVAIAGTQFLRLTEADLNSGTVDSCSH